MQLFLSEITSALVLALYEVYLQVPRKNLKPLHPPIQSPRRERQQPDR
jgi:hypothetical protein